MASVNAGDPDCTTGLSARIYNQFINDANNGFWPQYKDTPAKEIKSMCYAVALGVANEINADGGVGGSAGITGSGVAGNLMEWATGTTAGDSGIPVSSVALLNSPALTGTPTAPTPPNGDNSTRLATTAFVQANGGGGSSIVPTRRVRKLFDVRPADSAITSGFNGSWSYTAGGTPAQVTYPQDQPASCLYLQANSGHAELESSNLHIIYAKRRPKLIVSAKFGLWTGQTPIVGWVFNAAGGGAWSDIDYPGAGIAFAKIYGGAQMGNNNCWVCRCCDGTNALTFSSSVPVFDGKWHTFVIDFSDASKMNFYIDQTLLTSMSGTGLPRDPNNYGGIAVVDSIYNTGGPYSGGNGCELWCSAIDLEEQYPQNV